MSLKNSVRLHQCDSADQRGAGNCTAPVRHGDTVHGARCTVHGAADTVHSDEAVEEVQLERSYPASAQC